MLKELKLASRSYVNIANQYDDLVEECGSLEFIAINSGIASKQANNDSFMKLSSEIQNMSNEVTETAYNGRKTAFQCVDRTTNSYAQLLTKIRNYNQWARTGEMQPNMEKYGRTLKKEIEDFDISHLKRVTSQMARTLESLSALVNIGKTMAVGGKIKAVYITGSEEKFRIITETMQESIDRLFKLLENISVEFSIIQSQFNNIKAEEV